MSFKEICDKTGFGKTSELIRGKNKAEAPGRRRLLRKGWSGGGGRKLSYLEKRRDHGVRQKAFKAQKKKKKEALIGGI